MKFTTDSGFPNPTFFIDDGVSGVTVGYYTESFFAERDIRYITINDGVDSDKGDNDFTPFRNLFNDFYARDTSKKIRAVMRAKGNAGEPLHQSTLRVHERPNG